MSFYSKFKDGYRVDKEKIGTVDIINTIVRVIGFIVLLCVLIYSVINYSILPEIINLQYLDKEVYGPKILMLLPFLSGFTACIICEILRRLEVKIKYKGLTEESKKKVQFIRYMWFNFLEIISVIFFSSWAVSVVCQERMLNSIVCLMGFGFLLSAAIVIILSLIFTKKESK